MPTRTWKIVLEDQPYAIRFTYGLWSKKRQVFVNERLAASDFHFAFSRLAPLIFSIDARPAEVQMLSSGFAYHYLLSVDDRILLDAQNNPNNGLVKNALRDWRFWHDLARATGLRYLPNTDVDVFFSHRLAGVIQGYPIVVYIRRFQLSLEVMARLAPVSNPDQLRRQMAPEDWFQTLAGEHPTEQVTLTESQLAYRVPYKPEHEDAADMARELQETLAQLSRYASPLRLDECQNRSTSEPAHQAPKLVLLNGVPNVLCANCLDDLPRRAQAALDANAGSQRLKAGLVALGVFLVGTLVSAAVEYYLNGNSQVSLVSGLLVYAFILWLLDKIRGQRHCSSALLAWGLAVGAILLSEYLAFLWLLVQYPPRPLTSPADLWSLLVQTWQTVWPPYGSFRVVVGLLSLLGIGQAISSWFVQRAWVKTVLHPRVEIVDPGTPEAFH